MRISITKKKKSDVGYGKKKGHVYFITVRGKHGNILSEHKALNVKAKNRIVKTIKSYMRIPKKRR